VTLVIHVAVFAGKSFYATFIYSSFILARYGVLFTEGSQPFAEYKSFNVNVEIFLFKYL